MCRDFQSLGSLTEYGALQSGSFLFCSIECTIVVAEFWIVYRVSFL
jgi:hypothetical protein